MSKVINKPNGEIELKLTLNQLQLLSQVYRGFDGYSTVVEDGDGKKRNATEPFRFSTNPKVYLIIAKCQSALMPIMEKFQKAQEALLKSKLPKGESSLDARKNPKEFNSYIQALEKMTSEEEPVRLFILKVGDLDLDKNPIPPGLIGPLYRHGLLVEDGEGATP